MSFASFCKGEEADIAARILSSFGVVEERQMAALFSYMTDRAYGAFMLKLRREGIVNCFEDGKYLSTNILTYEMTDLRYSIPCFWAFIAVRNKIQAFYPGEAPTVVTVSAETSECDLIPVVKENIEEINEACFDLTDWTIRYLVTEDLNLTEKLIGRRKNDYVIHVGPDGIIAAYEL